MRLEKNVDEKRARSWERNTFSPKVTVNSICFQDIDDIGPSDGR